MVSLSDYDLCLALSYSYLYVIFLFQELSKSREMRAVVGHTERKEVQLSHAIGTLLKNDV